MKIKKDQFLFWFPPSFVQNFFLDLCSGIFLGRFWGPSKVPFIKSEKATWKANAFPALAPGWLILQNIMNNKKNIKNIICNENEKRGRTFSWKKLFNPPNSEAGDRDPEVEISVTSEQNVQSHPNYSHNIKSPRNVTLNATGEIIIHNIQMC